MGSPSRTRLQSWRHFSWLGPSLPWLLQPQSLSPRLMLIRGTAMATVDTDGEATTGLMATMATTERDPQMLSQSLLLLLILTLMLMPGTDTMATDTVAGDTEATTGLMATMATTEKGPQMLSLSPQLLLSPMLMLILGTAMATVAMDGVATTDLMDTTAMGTVDMDGAATTGPMDMGVTGEVIGAKQTNREVDSSSDCDFCRH